MQAVRVDGRPPDTRWLHHLSLLGALGLLLASVVIGRQQGPAELAQRLPGRFLAPPGSPAQEWLPVRVPVRTTITPDPTQPNLAPPVDAVTMADATLAAAVPRLEWV